MTAQEMDELEKRVRMLESYRSEHERKLYRWAVLLKVIVEEIVPSHPKAAKAIADYAVNNHFFD